MAKKVGNLEVDVQISKQGVSVDTNVANRSSGIINVLHDDTLLGTGNKDPLRVNTEIIATKKDLENIDTVVYHDETLEGTGSEEDPLKVVRDSLNIPSKTSELENDSDFATQADLEKLALPDQTGNAGKFLMTDGTDVSWQDEKKYIAGNGITFEDPFENDEYKQVEYIEFSGNEYVDTGLTDAEGYEYSMTVYPTAADTSYRGLFGFNFQLAENGPANSIAIVKQSGSTPHLRAYYTDSSTGVGAYRYIAAVSLNTWYTVESKTNSFVVNGEVKYEYTRGYTDFPAKIVFGSRTVGSSTDPSGWSINSSRFIGRVSNFKITDASIGVIHNFVPVKSKTSDEVGYYDTIGGNFVPLVNKASENLYAVGPDYNVVKINAEAKKYIAGNGIIFEAPFENDEYKQVEYIETSGNEYIDTGFLNGVYCIYEATFSATSIDSTYRSIFGFYSSNISSTTANCARVVTVDGVKSLQAVYRESNTGETLISTLCPIEENKWYTVKSDVGGFYLDGKELLTYNQPSDEFPAKIILYGAWVGYSTDPTASNWSARPSFIGKISNFKITQYDEGVPSLKHNFIPVKSKNTDEVGFYDLITGYFAPLVNTASENLYTVSEDYDIKIETPYSIPDITDINNKFLFTDGTDIYWQSALINYAENPKRNIAFTNIGTGDYFVSINPEISGQVGKYCVGMGHGFLPKNYSVGIGYRLTLNTYSAAVGTYSKAGQYSVAMGYSASANYSECIAIGCGASCNYNDSISIGRYATSYRSIAIGNSANGGNAYGVALGLSTAANGTCSIAIGPHAKAELSGDSGYNQIAIGNTATTNAKAAIAIGAEANSNAEKAIQLGTGTNSNNGTLQVYDYTLMYNDGTIPYQRLSSYSPSDGQVLIYDDSLGELVWGEGGGGGMSEVNWGDITGNLTDQTDLNTELQNIHSGIQNLEQDFSTSTRRLESDIQDAEDRLQSQIDSLPSIGQFLAIWDCDTAIARYLTEGYQYQAGNYFIIGSVAAEGGVNYMPDGSSYPGSVETTEDVKVSDMWFYDGEHWIYLANHERAIAVDADLDVNSINPVENKAVTTAIDSINASIEELENRPSGVGVPQLASVSNAQIKDPYVAMDRAKDYGDWAGRFSEIIVTLNLDKQSLIDKMYDLYITTSRYKTNKNLSIEDSDEAEFKYRNISKFSVMNDRRIKTDQRIYCWRFITDSSWPATDPRRYVYMYTRNWYADGQALRDADPEVGLWYNYESPSNYGTCLNAIGWTSGLTAETVYQDMYDTDTGIERYEEGDISEIANVGGASQYLTTMHCRKYTKDGQNYFFWCADWDDEAAWVFVSSDGDDNILPNSIPKHMDTLNNLYNVANTLSIYTFVEHRPDLNYKSVSDRDGLLSYLEERTFQGYHVESNFAPMWECYWHDYPVMPVMLKDCDVRLHDSNADGRWHNFETVVKTPELLERLKDDIALEFKLPYNTYYYWMRFLAIQKRCCYGNPTDWMQEEGRIISDPMWPYQKNSLMEGIWNGGIFNKRAYGRKRSAYRNNSGMGKITECLEFNICSPMNVADGSKSTATPIQKKIVVNNNGGTVLRD